MKSRLIASLALGAAVVLGATGCNMIAPQATTIDYSPSDGVNVPDSGPILVRNAMIITDDEGVSGNFLAALVNDTDEDLELIVGLGDEVQIIPVDARDVVSLGVDTAPMLFQDLDTPAGATIEVAFQSGEGSGVAIEVPILDGELPYYADFVPTFG